MVKVINRLPKSKESEQLSQILSQINSGRFDLENIEKEKKDKLKEIDRLNKEIEDRKEAVTYMNGLANVCTEKLRESEQKLGLADIKVQEMEKAKTKVKDKIEKELKEVNEELDLRIGQLKFYNGTTKDLEAKIASQNKALDTLNTNIQTLETGHNLRMKYLVDTISAKEKQIEKQIKTIVELQNKHDLLSNSIKSLNSLENEAKKNTEIAKENLKEIKDKEKELILESKRIQDVINKQEKQINSQKEALLLLVAREKKVNESADKVKNLYKRAGIDVTI